MTSTDLATTNCGSDNDDISAISLMQPNLLHRQCCRNRSKNATAKATIKVKVKVKAKAKPIPTMQFNQIVFNIAVYMFATIILLNTIGLNSVVRADTVQYPVTAPFGSGLIPPGKRQHNYKHLNF